MEDEYHPMVNKMQAKNNHVLGIGTYVMLYNLLDWPAGVLPVTKVTQKDIDDLKNYHTGDDIEDYIRKVVNYLMLKDS